ncbi:hypothetical protein [Pseudodesulfovibrio karagichevae]|uniref:Uncharacterized protein n=1 Tax=Pseudodesulfovibrio karagichevae TaxID=3239305 RepID=A0ABV4K0M0_9BACT
MTTKKTRYRPDLSTLDNVAAEVGKIYRLMRNDEIPVQDGSKYTYVLREMFSMMEKLKSTAAIEKLEADIQALKEGRVVGDDTDVEAAAKAIHGD